LEREVEEEWGWWSRGWKNRVEKTHDHGKKVEEKEREREREEEGGGEGEAERGGTVRGDEGKKRWKSPPDYSRNTPPTTTSHPSKRRHSPLTSSRNFTMIILLIAFIKFLYRKKI